MLPFTPRQGVFSAAEARTHGMSGHQLQRLVALEAIHRLSRGWYAVGAPGQPWVEHRDRAVAMARHFHGAAALSHYSAAVAHGVATWRADYEQVHLVHLADDWSRHRAGTIVHQRIPGLTIRSGIVPVAVSVVQCGLLGMPVAALVAADSALHQRLTTQSDILSATTLFAGHRGIVATRAVLNQAEGRSESVGESLTRHTLSHLGWETTPQVVIPDGGVNWRVDLLLTGQRVVIEFDGAGKYASHADLISEKRREDRLRELGYEFVRVTWADLRRPDQLAGRVWAALGRAQSRRAS